MKTFLKNIWDKYVALLKMKHDAAFPAMNLVILMQIVVFGFFAYSYGFFGVFFGAWVGAAMTMSVIVTRDVVKDMLPKEKTLSSAIADAAETIPMPTVKGPKACTGDCSCATQPIILPVKPIEQENRRQEEITIKRERDKEPGKDGAFDQLKE